jgi:phage terminase small subunit
MSDKQKLTTKQRLFVEAYLTAPNGVQAARKAGYQGDENTLAMTASRLIRNDKVSKLINSRVETAIITADEVLLGIKNIAVNGEKESDQLKGYELLGKHLKLFTDKTETEHSGSQIIEIVYTKE